MDSKGLIVFLPIKLFKALLKLLMKFKSIILCCILFSFFAISYTQYVCGMLVAANVVSRDDERSYSATLEADLI